jgi:hypothetical protein
LINRQAVVFVSAGCFGCDSARLAIQERDWKKKRAELKRRMESLQAMNVKARDLEKALQDANKKLKERLRSLHGVFAVSVEAVFNSNARKLG